MYDVDILERTTHVALIEMVTIFNNFILLMKDLLKGRKQIPSIPAQKVCLVDDGFIFMTYWSSMLLNSL